MAKKADELPDRPFKFLDPFSTELWMYILITALAVGVTVSVVNKLSPYDHHGEMVHARNGRLEDESVLLLWEENTQSTSN